MIKRDISPLLWRIFPVAFSLLMGVALSGCFTGVEGTKKIELSRSDKHSSRRSASESLMDSVQALPLSAWKKGRPFYVADNRLSLVLVPRDGFSLEASDSLGGRIIRFEGVGSRRLPDGSEAGVLSFSYDGRIYDYTLSRSLRSAMASTRSDALPLMTDLDMVTQADKLLKGRRVWTLTNLWYTPDGERMVGEKFVPVTITGVSTGNEVFPLAVSFVNDKGIKSVMYMNFGHSAADSRSFDSLFSLSDVKSRYPRIHSDVWQLICRGTVKPGMNKEECRLALGAPADVSPGHDWSRTVDIWKYTDGRYLVFTDGVLTDYRL